MTKQQHTEALKALKEINKLTISSETLIDKDTVRIDYKHQRILMKNGFTLILSGSLEQHNTIHCTTEHLFLVLSLEDQVGTDLDFTKSQHAQFKNQIGNLLKV